MLDLHPVNGQVINYSYLCQSSTEGYTTIARSSQGYAPLINWENHRQGICNTVSNRFQTAKENENLRFLVRENDLICGTNIYGGRCRNLLFQADGDMTAEALWRQLTNNSGRLINGQPINGRYITQSDDREYFNLEQYLLDNTVSSNQSVSKNK